MEALRPKLVNHLSSMMATTADAVGSTSGVLTPSSAGRIADAVLSVTRGHDEDYARTLPLTAAFRRLPVEIKVNEATAPFADGYLTEESAAMLCAAAEREFAARQREADSWAAPWKGDRSADADPELTAMTVATAHLEPLDMEAQARVMHWLVDRFHVDL